MAARQKCTGKFDDSDDVKMFSRPCSVTGYKNGTVDLLVLVTCKEITENLFWNIGVSLLYVKFVIMKMPVSYKRVLAIFCGLSNMYILQLLASVISEKIAKTDTSLARQNVLITFKNKNIRK